MKKQTDYCDVYPVVEGISCQDFKLQKTRLSEEQINSALKQLYDYETVHKEFFLGYQTNLKMDYAKDFSPYLNIHLNNVGDPFQSGNLMTNTKWMERAVLDYYAELWNLKTPHLSNDQVYSMEEIGESYWGYIASMGSTEGNLYGLRNGRDYLAGKLLMVDMDGDDPYSKRKRRKGRILKKGHIVNVRPDEMNRVSHEATHHNLQVQDNNAYKPVLFYSEDTHYSVDKIKDILNVNTFFELGEELFEGQCPINEGVWPEKVPSNEDGSVNREALRKLVAFFAEKGYPFLLSLNYGTTFKGAYDDVESITEDMKEIAVQNGLYERVIEVEKGGRVYRTIRNGFWIHVDGALGAAYMPFLQMALERGEFNSPVRIPKFDFSLHIHSLSMSGHKYIGSPWPSGIFMTKTKYLLHFEQIGYIGSQDSTLSGSRNGFTAMIFWRYLANKSYEDQITTALEIQAKVERTHNKLLALQKQLGMNLYVGHTPLALTIRFLRPNEEIIAKYSLSTDELDGIKYAHIFIMEHVTDELIDDLIQSLSTPNAFSKESRKNVVEIT